MRDRETFENRMREMTLFEKKYACVSLYGTPTEVRVSIIDPVQPVYLIKPEMHFKIYILNSSALSWFRISSIPSHYV